MSLEPAATLPALASAIPQTGTNNPPAILSAAGSESQAFRQALQQQIQNADTMLPGATLVQASLDAILHLPAGELGTPAQSTGLPSSSAGNFLPAGKASGENDEPDAATMAWLAQLLTPPGQTLPEGDTVHLKDSDSSRSPSDLIVAFMPSTAPMPDTSTAPGTPAQPSAFEPPIFPWGGDPLPESTAPIVTQAASVAVTSAGLDATFLVADNTRSPSAPTSSGGQILPSGSAVMMAGIDDTWVETNHPNQPGTPRPALGEPALPNFLSESASPLDLVDLHLSGDRESTSVQPPAIEDSSAIMAAIPHVGEETSPNLEHSAAATPFLSVNLSPPRTETLPVLSRPIDHPEWQQDLGDRVLWMTGHGKQVAELTLHPAELGPLEVRIQLNQDHASIQFLSNHAAVREAVESALPKLREMFGTQHIDLHDVTVVQPSFSDSRGSAFATGHQHPGSGDEQRHSGRPADDSTRYSEPESALVASLSNKGLLNLYA